MVMLEFGSVIVEKILRQDRDDRASLAGGGRGLEGYTRRMNEGETPRETGTPQKVERPRDRFGRPLPPGSVNRLDLPAFETMSVEENHRLALQFFNEGVFFGAHEAWETAWRASHGTPDEAFFKALAQLGAGYTHYQRNNPHGVRALLTRAAIGLIEYPAVHRDLDVRALLRGIEGDLKRLGPRDREEGVPPLEPPRL
jgi:hypothetical protein